MNTSTPFKNHSMAWHRPTAFSLASSQCSKTLRQLRKQYPRHYPEAFQFIQDCLTLSQSCHKEHQALLLAEQAKPEDEQRNFSKTSRDEVAYLFAALQGLIESYSFVHHAMYPHETQSRSPREDDNKMIAELTRDCIGFAKKLARIFLDRDNQSRYDLDEAEAMALHVLFIFDERRSIEIWPDELLEILADWEEILARSRRQMAENLEADVKKKRLLRVELNSSRKQYYNAFKVIWGNFLEQLSEKAKLIENEAQPICLDYSTPVKAHHADQKPRVLHMRFHALIERQPDKPYYDYPVNFELLAQLIWDNCKRKLVEPKQGINEICPERVWCATDTFTHNGSKLNLLDPRFSIWTTWEGEDAVSKDHEDWYADRKDTNPLMFNLVDGDLEASIAALPLDEEGRLVLRPYRELHLLIPSDKPASFYLTTELFDLIDSRTADGTTLLAFRVRSACLKGAQADKMIFADFRQGYKRYEVPITVDRIHQIDISF